MLVNSKIRFDDDKEVENISKFLFSFSWILVYKMWWSNYNLKPNFLHFKNFSFNLENLCFSLSKLNIYFFISYLI
jgi:hypothetical protein